MKIKDNNKIIVIAGPTASGKTNLAIDLAKKIGGEIINADSRSIYRGMDIGTGKPKLKLPAISCQLSGYLVKNIPHHLFDIKDPDETFSVAEFKKLAQIKIAEIKKREHVPIIVGGTGLYLDAFIYNYRMPEAKPNTELRLKFESRDTEDLFAELKEIDQDTAEKIDPKNKRRVIRALEIYYQTRKSKITEEKRKPLPDNIYYFAIDCPRKELYEIINDRVKEMFLNNGIIKETKELLKKYSPELPIMKTMGYGEANEFLSKKISLEEAIKKTSQRHRNLAKRQMTWFRRNKDIIWIKPKVEEIINRI